MNNRSVKYKVILALFCIGIIIGGCAKEPKESDVGLFEYDDSAPVVMEVYPRIAKGVLSHARLMDMPEGILIRTETVTLSQKDLNDELEKMVPENRQIFGSNQFLLADQMAAGSIMEQEARRQMSLTGEDVSSLDQNMLLQKWIESKISDITVSDSEIEDFYNANREFIPQDQYEQVRSQIGNYLLQQKQQAVIELLVTEMGKRVEIAVNAEWAKTQDEIGRDNDVDRARDSGMPTMASFGADSCGSCQDMKPIQESVKEKYEGKVNFVYVHADIDQLISARYGIRSIPHMIFFDSEGNIFHEHTGPMTEEEIESHLLKMGVDKI